MGIFDFLTELIRTNQNKKDSQVVVKNYISGNNNQNNKNNSTRTQKRITKSTKTTNNKISANNTAVSLQSIRLYCTGAKGKVYTDTFRKSINHNFGIEVIIRNNTSQTQTVKLGNCIYSEDGDKTFFKGTFRPKIKPYTTLTEDIFVDAKAFAKMRKGRYKSQFWINDKRVQRVYFNVDNK